MSRGSLSATPIVGENNNALPLNSDGTVDQQAIAEHNCWVFELTAVKPAGATYDLTFAAERLSKIIYRRARVRVD